MQLPYFPKHTLTLVYSTLVWRLEANDVRLTCDRRLSSDVGVDPSFLRVPSAIAKLTKKALTPLLPLRPRPPQATIVCFHRRPRFQPWQSYVGDFSPTACDDSSLLRSAKRGVDQGSCQWLANNNTNQRGRRMVKYPGRG